MNARWGAVCLSIGLAACAAADSTALVTPTVSDLPETWTSSYVASAGPCASDLGTFGGLHWTARQASNAGPGPNTWSNCNAWIDSSGLHLRVARQAGGWASAEVVTTEALGPGRFEFVTKTPLHALDRNIVFGFFTYPPGGPDGTHEIDIEFARFGAASGTNLNFVVYPSTAGRASQCSTNWTPSTAGTLHRFLWSATAVEFQSFGVDRVGALTVPDRSWLMTPGNGFSISSGAWPLHLNLWMYLGAPPADGLPAEVVIQRVSYTASTPPHVASSSTCR